MLFIRYAQKLVSGHIAGKATEVVSFTHRMSIVERALGQPSSCRIFFVSSLLAQASLPTKNSTCTPACKHMPGDQSIS